MSATKVGVLTAGGLAPCLSSALGYLIEMYTEKDPNIEILCYKSGYKGLLSGDSVLVSAEMRAKATTLQEHGGSPIGNSRVKLTNIADCVARGLIKEGESPLAVACKQLESDQITILHTIGGDDTNTQAAELAKYLDAESGYKLTVVGLPKTIDNDVFPIRQSLGAFTAAEEGAHFFSNVVNECSANPRMLILHEVMGRDCGWLTAYTAKVYREEKMEAQSWVEGLGGSSSMQSKDVHAVYVPEIVVDIEAEAARLKAVMDANDCWCERQRYLQRGQTASSLCRALCTSICERCELACLRSESLHWVCSNIFLSEGAGVESIVAEMEARGDEVPRDAFGHIKLDKINPGAWFAKQFAQKIGAQKVLVQKSGYYSRAAPANAQDRALIKECCEVGVAAALSGTTGCIGHDEDQGDVLRPIEFPRIKGGKPFDASVGWFQALLGSIGQPTSACHVELLRLEQSNDRSSEDGGATTVVGLGLSTPKVGAGTRA
jgi:pyrophosphate--fructose-6-phosphate 1-phosphotransferase